MPIVKPNVLSAIQGGILRVLITRPAYAVAGLVQQLKKLKAIPELLPTIEIHPMPNQTALKHALAQLPTVYMAIFVSRAAVQFGMAAIKQYGEPLPALQWAAIGPGTANALQQHAIHQIITPTKPPYETESLLALADFHTIAGKRIFIFKGNGGRALLSQVLQERGAIVQPVEVYKRTLPNINMVEKLTTWKHYPIDVIVTTSAECLNNLLLLMGPDVPWLKQIPLVVVGPRMYELAKSQAFKLPIVAPGADDASIIKVLTTLKGS
jgi:uroporphyrinogen-III synthase